MEGSAVGGAGGEGAQGRWWGGGDAEAAEVMGGRKGKKGKGRLFEGGGDEEGVGVRKGDADERLGRRMHYCYETGYNCYKAMERACLSKKLRRCTHHILTMSALALSNR